MSIHVDNSRSAPGKQAPDLKQPTDFKEPIPEQQAAHYDSKIDNAHRRNPTHSTDPELFVEGNEAPSEDVDFSLLTGTSNVMSAPEGLSDQDKVSVNFSNS